MSGSRIWETLHSRCLKPGPPAGSLTCVSLCPAGPAARRCWRRSRSACVEGSPLFPRDAGKDTEPSAKAQRGALPPPEGVLDSGTPAGEVGRVVVPRPGVMCEASAEERVIGHHPGGAVGQKGLLGTLPPHPTGSSLRRHRTFRGLRVPKQEQRVPDPGSLWGFRPPGQPEPEADRSTALSLQRKRPRLRPRGGRGWPRIPQQGCLLVGPQPRHPSWEAL